MCSELKTAMNLRNMLTFASFTIIDYYLKTVTLVILLIILKTPTVECYKKKYIVNWVEKLDHDNFYYHCIVSIIHWKTAPHLILT